MHPLISNQVLEKTVFKNTLYNNVFYCSSMKKYCEENNINWVLYDIMNIIKKNKLVHFKSLEIKLECKGENSILSFIYEKNPIIVKEYLFQKIVLKSNENKVVFSYFNNTICHYD